MPPAGVDNKRSGKGFLGEVKLHRANQLTNGPSALNRRTPDHKLVTEYRYNTLNQIVEQKTPDAGVSRFWYDRLGRLVVSQNAQQVLSKKYSYTMYDEIGRITQVGAKPQQTAMTPAISHDVRLLDVWLNTTQDKESIMRTVYDVSYYAGEETGTLEPRLYQKNLRNRVSYTQLIDKEPAGTDARKWVTAHSAATYYSYDIHGNVKELLQDYNAKSMSESGNRFKKIVYAYDLVSGKVNEVAYQPGYADQFFHRYSYDAENRLTDVETSDDRIFWEKDARYYYYRHGPLGRAIIGGQQVQGLDYSYTLQGWLKGVNSSNVNAPAGRLGLGDMGGDGYGLLNPVARDAFGFGLSYYQNDAQGEADYKPVAAPAGVKPFANAAAAGFGFKALYNGNIAAMSVNIPKIGEPLLYTYQYDQLNRFVKLNTYNGLNAATNSWNTRTVDAYREQVTYDGNGNILTYKRNGDEARSNAAMTGMDNLSYSYTTGTNRLDKVVDVARDVLEAEYEKYNDIKEGQQDGNYRYDAIGNLVAAASEGIDRVEWTVYGKIKSIVKADGMRIEYSYDASGNRIMKRVDGKETWYVRDASGNVMSVYTAGGSSVVQSEVHLYGSSRLGIWNAGRDVSALAKVDYPAVRTTFTRGNKFFELSNHLGNVLATVSDKKVAVSGDGLRVDYYTAEVVSAQDYYPFGMQMPGRKFSSERYRYGFNGQEKSTEINGSESLYTAQFWQYESRIGRRWNVDPRPNVSLSNYVAFANNPIWYSDPLGDTLRPGAGFWVNAWEGLKQGGRDTKNFVKSLGTKEGWGNLAEGMQTMSGMDPASMGKRAVMAQNMIEGVKDISKMNVDQWGHAVGYGTEKIAETVLLSKGVGMVKNASTSTATIVDMTTLYHTTTKAGAASNILAEGINPAFFNSASRFGKGFYMSNNVNTTLAEVAFHKVTPVNTIQFTLKGGNYLNATSPAMSLGVRYTPKLVSGVAKTLGRDGIMYNSLRGNGINMVQLKNFNLLSNGRIIH